MNNYKVLIAKHDYDGHVMMLKEFDIYNSDYDTVKEIAQSYINEYFDNSFFHIFKK